METADPGASFTSLSIEPGLVSLRVETGLEDGGWGYKYHRLVDLLPFLSYVSQEVCGSGELDVELSDYGAPGKLSFSGKRGWNLIPDIAFLSSGAYAAERSGASPAGATRDPRVLWRGSTTGLRSGGWRSLQRARLCDVAAKSQDELGYDVGFNTVVQARSSQEEDEIRAAGFMRPSISSSRYKDFRYHIDIDGNTNSWSGLFTKLLSGGLTFKVDSPHDHRQWYYERLQPWVHYVPVDATLSNLDDVVRWARRHDDRARDMAASACSLAESMTLEHEAAYGLAVIEGALGRIGADFEQPGAASADGRA